jgi:peptidoglycan/xylan/chitin deacetylase (PgdA/CDA1 family)
MYHHVSSAPGLVTVSPAVFRAHMEALAQGGWHTLGAAEVTRFFRGEPLLERSCILTFDDGYLDNFIHAHPVLKALGLRALIFTVSAWMGEGPIRTGSQDLPDHNECKRRIAQGDADSVIMRWSEAEAAQADGVFEFHSHTHSHRRWDREITDPARRIEALAQDLSASRAALKERLGVDSSHLCWPQGYYDADYVATARRCGFDHLYTTEKRLNLPSSSPLGIGRVVTKERPGPWLARRASIYASPWLGRAYNWLQRRPG